MVDNCQAEATRSPSPTGSGRFRGGALTKLRKAVCGSVDGELAAFGSSALLFVCERRKKRVDISRLTFHD